MNIQEKIKETFQGQAEIPLFYIESGSRLWGIASPDSDFDVRGFHLQSKIQYFNFKKDAGLIEKMDGDFDFVSYDVDKMFGLLSKSNPTVFEWIRADISYLNNLPDWENFKNNLIKNFDFKALFFHYLSLAKGHIKVMEREKKFSYKVVFYCIRGLLSANLSSKNIIPAFLIDELFKQSEEDKNAKKVLEIAKNALEKKKTRNEKEEVLDSEKEEIVSAITEFLNYLETLEVKSTNNQEKLYEVLKDYAFKLKSEYYK